MIPTPVCKVEQFSYTHEAGVGYLAGVHKVYSSAEGVGRGRRRGRSLMCIRWNGVRTIPGADCIRRCGSTGCWTMCLQMPKVCSERESWIESNRSVNI